MTREGVRAEYVAAMGPQLGELFDVLSLELTWLFWRWNEYASLYGGPPSRLEMLNRAAPFFFYIIQQTLWYEVLLGIARLAGPEATGSKQNLSVRRLIPLLPEHALKADAAGLLDQVAGTAAFAIAWRNRHIAHRDFELSLGTSATPLPSTSREQVEAALDALAKLLNRIQRHFLNSTTAYSFSAGPHGAESLLHVLRDGLRREELRQEKLERGIYDPEDWDDHLPAV